MPDREVVGWIEKNPCFRDRAYFEEGVLQNLDSVNALTGALLGAKM